MGNELKIGDFVRCRYNPNSSVGYAKILKIKQTISTYLEGGLHHSETLELDILVERYVDHIISEAKSVYTNFEITVQFVGYDLVDGLLGNNLADIVEVDEIRDVTVDHIFNVLTEEKISQLRNSWDRAIRQKLDFLYKHINKEPLEGRKSLTNLKIT